VLRKSLRRSTFRLSKRTPVRSVSSSFVGKLSGDATPRIGGEPICAALVNLRRPPEHSSMIGIEKFVDVPRRVGAVTPTGTSLGAPVPRSVFG
jgi:hypothetical protein